MSNGATHDSVNTLCCLAITGYSIATNNVLGLFTAGGFALGTAFLSPDLDLVKSNPTNRLWLLKPLFAPYRNLCGHHRSFISHSPILSSLIRVFYCLIPVIFYLFYQHQEALIFKAFEDTRLISVLVGLELSTDMHLILDWQYSLRKKIRHF